MIAPDELRELEEPEQDFTICPHCGEDLPHHDCQAEEDRERDS